MEESSGVDDDEGLLNQCLEREQPRDISVSCADCTRWVIQQMKLVSQRGGRERAKFTNPAGKAHCRKHEEF